jgi:hypothetical protein
LKSCAVVTAVRCKSSFRLALKGEPNLRAFRSHPAAHRLVTKPGFAAPLSRLLFSIKHNSYMLFVSREGLQLSLFVF